MTAAIVLAAGLSRRMRQPKLLLPVDGVPIIRRVVERLLAAGIEHVLVVVAPDAAPVSRALEGLPVRLVRNPTPEHGQASSIVAGIAALGSEVGCALIALGDQPGVSASVIRGLVAAQATSGRPIVAPMYRDGLGNPVLFAREIFPELLALDGDRGARMLVERDPSRLQLMPVDTAMPPDIDTPDDYERVKSTEHTV